MNEMIISPPTANEIRLLEETLLDPTVRASSEVLQDLLADEFVEFGASGHTYTKQQVIAGLLQQPAAHFAIQNFSLRLLGPGVVLATYQVVRQRNPSRKEKYSLRSSIWKYVQGRWQMIFHQGTPIASKGIDDDRAKIDTGQGTEDAG